MNWADSGVFFQENAGNLIFQPIFGHQRAKIESGNTKMNIGQETHEEG